MFSKNESQFYQLIKTLTKKKKVKSKIIDKKAKDKKRTNEQIKK